MPQTRSAGNKKLKQRSELERAGSRDQRREIAKPKAKEADPGIIAAEIIAGNSLDGIPLLRYWGASWWKWSRGRYAELPETELRAIIINHLNREWSHVKKCHATDVIEHLRAGLLLPADISPPTWFGTTPNGFAAPECLCTADEIIHLPTLTERGLDYSIPASPRLFSLNACDCEIDLTSPPPARWLSFLADQWPNDQESIDTLQEVFGYFLTADTRYQKIFALIGPKRSGKGTICRLLRKVVGERNVAGPTLSSLATNFGLSPLLGKSVAIVSDARLSSRSDQAVVVERLLSISGEDKLTIDRKHAQAVDCQLRARVVIASNELPRFVDASATVVSRIILLKTTRSFMGEEDTELESKLAAELPGILLWAIEGRQRLQTRGRFIQPAAGKDALTSMVHLASPVMSFVEDRCELSPSAVCPKAVLHGAFKQWCNTDAGIERVPTSAMFGRDLIAAYPQITDARQRAGGKREYCYVGITLKTFDDVMRGIE
jgi:putative DNA primase/helicase